MKSAQTYFIIGVNGVGKSTVMPYIRVLTGDTGFAIHDFDERGVPNNAGKDWRESETLHWMQTGKSNVEKNITTLICGFSKVAEVVEAARLTGIEAHIILLDATPEIITSRISKRYQTPESLAELLRTTGKTPEKFTMDNIYVSSQFRDACSAAGFPIIDTSARTPEEVAREIQRIIISH